MDYTVYILTQGVLLAIAAVGLNLLVGYAGQISLGHGAFLAIGAYLHLILYRAGVPLPLSGAIATGGAAVCGLLLGVPGLRLRGPYLAIATLGFQVAVEQILSRWDGLTGGRMGLDVPTAVLVVPLSPGAYLLVSLLILVLVLAGVRNLSRSRFGRVLAAIRSSETLAASVGVDVARTKVGVFMLSAGITGAAGALMVHLGDAIYPNSYTLLESIELLVIVVLGGARSVSGPVLGAFAVVALTHLLGPIQEHQGLVLGAILVLIILFEPEGLRGYWRRIQVRVGRRRSG